VTRLFGRTWRRCPKSFELGRWSAGTDTGAFLGLGPANGGIAGDQQAAIVPGFRLLSTRAAEVPYGTGSFVWSKPAASGDFQRADCDHGGVVAQEGRTYAKEGAV